MPNLPRDPRKLRRIEKLVEIRDTRVDFFLNHHKNSMGFKLDAKYWYLHDIYNSLAPDIVLQSCVQSGKVAPLDELIRTPTGWTTHGEIEVGYRS